MEKQREEAKAAAEAAAKEAAYGDSESDEEKDEDAAIAKAAATDIKAWKAANTAAEKEALREHRTNFEPQGFVAFVKEREAREAALREAEEEAAALQGHEQLSSDAMLRRWRHHQRQLLVCESAADAMRVLLRDGSNFLGALAAAERITSNTRAWPHRELCPLPLVLTKEVLCVVPHRTS